MPFALRQGPTIHVTVKVTGPRRRGEPKKYLFSQTFSLTGSADEIEAREFAARLYEALRERTAELLNSTTVATGANRQEAPMISRDGDRSPTKVHDAPA